MKSTNKKCPSTKTVLLSLNTIYQIWNQNISLDDSKKKNEKEIKVYIWNDYNSLTANKNFRKIHTSLIRLQKEKWGPTLTRWWFSVLFPRLILSETPYIIRTHGAGVINPVVQLVRKGTITPEQRKLQIINTIKAF